MLMIVKYNHGGQLRYPSWGIGGEVIKGDIDVGGDLENDSDESDESFKVTSFVCLSKNSLTGVSFIVDKNEMGYKDELKVEN